MRWRSSSCSCSRLRDRVLSMPPSMLCDSSSLASSCSRWSTSRSAASSTAWASLAPSSRRRVSACLELSSARRRAASARSPSSSAASASRRAASPSRTLARSRGPVEFVAQFVETGVVVPRNGVVEKHEKVDVAVGAGTGIAWRCRYARRQQRNDDCRYDEAAHQTVGLWIPSGAPLIIKTMASSIIIRLAKSRCCAALEASSCEVS